MITNVQLDYFSSSSEMAKEAAAQLVTLVQASPAPFHLALSGGRIAAPFYQQIVACCRERRAGLDRVHFFWADERCVPAQHPESNYRVAGQELFAPLGIEPTRVHRIPGELGNIPAAAVAEQELRAVTGGLAGEVPVLNLVVLGVGEDAHVASLFPGDLESAPGTVYRPVTGPKAPVQRVTLDYGPLRAARQVWCLVSGAGKEEALKKSLAGSPTPLGKVLRERVMTRIFHDLKLAPDAWADGRKAAK